MPLFLDNAASNARIIDTIKKADDALLLISPYVQLSPAVSRWLATVDKKGVRTDLICRVPDLSGSEKAKLSAYENLTVYHYEDLHAKCYANASGVVLTSLNLYDASRKNSEMGVYFDAGDDPVLYREAMDEARHLLEHADAVDVGGLKPAKKRTVWLSRSSRKTSEAARTLTGFCIRCGANVAYGPDKPYCAACFRQWARFKNPAYADDRCHGCGTEQGGGFSLEKPECYQCYKKHARSTA